MPSAWAAWLRVGELFDVARLAHDRPRRPIRWRLLGSPDRLLSRLEVAAQRVDAPLLPLSSRYHDA